MIPNHTPQSLQHKNISKLSTQQLRTLLASLQDKNESLSTKNQELVNQAQDLRNVIKCVDKENKEQIECLLNKKKIMEDQVHKIERQLNVIHKSDNFKKMIAFKQIMEE